MQGKCVIKWVKTGKEMRDKSVHTLNNRYESLPDSEWTNDATSGTTFVRRGDSTSIVLTDPQYPMKIKNAIVSSSIVQSSPYPCDKNTITVTLMTDIDLYPRCTPSLSLTGLEQSGTASGQLTATVAQTGDRPGTWTNADGTLIFNIFHDDDAQSSATTAGDADAIKVGGQGITNYAIVSFSFELTNPQSQQDSPLTALSLKMIDTPPVGVADYTAAFHVEANHDSSTMTFYNTNGLVINDKDICSSSPQLMDARPLLIRSVTFTKLQVSQTSAYPCASNTISVVFQADGPIFSSCVNVLTLSGLSGSVTTGSRTLTSVSHG